ncbi:hypothetical protein ACIBTV_27440 [Micromonospora sp. NPDC049366]|uniref:hypothetical protein n=1 Tax=Micromonospora sp. NPDC049366 TaxID=3364271 RepID=UPI0037A112C9
MPLIIGAAEPERVVAVQLDRRAAGELDGPVRFRVLVDGQPAAVAPDPADPSWCLATPETAADRP